MSDLSKVFSPWTAYALAGQIGYLIAVPAAVFGFGGAYLDKHLGTSPLFLILGLALAFASSAVAVIRVVKIFEQKTLEAGKSPKRDSNSLPGA